jgi:glycerophosphoryl diester phosphodiesterase
MLTMAWRLEDGENKSVIRILYFLAERAPSLFNLALRLLTVALLSLIPFLLALALVYFLLLGEYDINYYLAVRPREWQLAVGAGVLISVAATLYFARLFVGWIFCLPLLLFNGLSAPAAVKASQSYARGRRWQIAAWLAAWLLFGVLLSTGVAALIGAAGSSLIPLAGNSINNLLLILAAVALGAWLLSFAVSFFEASMLGLINFALYLGTEAGQSDVADFSADAESRVPFRLGGRLIAAGLLAGTIVSFVLLSIQVQGLDFEIETEIIAHRGASFAAPENTLAAVEAAIEAGADWVEIDVQQTLDDEIVVIHDSDLKKVGRVPLTVAGSSASELREVDVGSWFGEEFGDQRVPLLSEVLELCRDRVGVNIELKYHGGEREMERQVAEIVEAAGMEDQVVVMSLSHAAVRTFRRLRPDWTVGLLSTVVLGDMAGLDVDFLAINGRAASRNLVRHAQGHGKKILVWTINDSVGMSTMILRGVDGIITDEPAMAVSVLEQKRELETYQLILLQLADIFDQPSRYRDQ